MACANQCKVCYTNLTTGAMHSHAGAWEQDTRHAGAFSCSHGPPWEPLPHLTIRSVCIPTQERGNEISRSQHLSCSHGPPWEPIPHLTIRSVCIPTQERGNEARRSVGTRCLSYNCATRSSMASAWPSAVTPYSTCLSWPALSIRKVERTIPIFFTPFFSFSCHTP